MGKLKAHAITAVQQHYRHATVTGNDVKPIHGIAGNPTSISMWCPSGKEEDSSSNVCTHIVYKWEDSRILQASSIQVVSLNIQVVSLNIQVVSKWYVHPTVIIKLKVTQLMRKAQHHFH